MSSQNIEVGLRFTADASQAKRELDSLKQNIVNAISSAKPTGNQSLFNDAIKDAEKFYGVLNKATDPNGALNLSRLQVGLKEAGLDIKQVANQFTQLGPEGAKAWQQINTQIQSANANASVLRGTLSKFAQGLKNTAMWTIQSNAIHAVQSALQGAYSYAQKLNKGLTDIAIVSNLNADQLAAFADSANKAAKELSTTTNEYVKGALIYYQQGLNDEAVKERTETTIKMANASGESAETISSYMTAIWNNFDKGSESVEYYADVIALLGATTAASNAQIAEGMQAFAATAETVGLSYEYSAAALTTLVDRTQQSASKIGTSLKTIFARLSSVSLGETLEDGVNLTKYTKALEKVGVDVLTATGDLKDMDEILDELGNKWDLLNQAQKVAVAQTVGGVRQYNNLISLLDNYDYFKELVNNAKESEGYLQTQQDKYAASWEGANKRVKASWETLYGEIINDDFFIKLANTLADVVSFVADIVKGLGGVPGVLSLIVATVAKLNPAGFAQGLANIKTEFTLLTQAIFRTQAALTGALQADAFDAFLGGLKTTQEQTGYLTDAIDRIHQLNQERLQAINDKDIVKAGVLDAEILRLTNLAKEAAEAEREISELSNSLRNIERTGDSKHWDDVDAAWEQFDAAKSGKNFLLQAQMSENPQEIVNTAKGVFKDIELEIDGQKTNIWDKFFAAEDIEKAINNPEIDAAIQQAMLGALDNAKTATDAALADISGKVKTEAESTGSEIDAVGEQLEWNLAEAGSNVEILVNKADGLKVPLEEAGTAGEQAGDKIEEGAKEASQEWENLTEKVKNYNTAAGNVAGGIVVNKKNPVKDTNKDVKQTSTYAIQAATSLLSMSTAMSALSDNLKSGDVDIKQLLGSLTSIAMTGNMARGALIKLGLAGPQALGVVVAIGALVAAYEALDWWQHREIDNLQKESEKQAEHAKEVQEAINHTKELGESVAELAEEYYTLKDAGESTYETLDKMREQAVDLADRYRELAEVLGIDLTGALADYERYVQTGQIDKAEEIRQEIEATVHAAEVGANQEAYAAAATSVRSGGSGTMHNGVYSSKGTLGMSGALNLGRLDAGTANIVTQNMGDFMQTQQVSRENGTNTRAWFEVDTEDANNVINYYDALVKTEQELRSIGDTSSEAYKLVTKEIDELKPKVEEFETVSKETASLFAKDIDTNYANASMSMTDFMNNHDALINDIKEGYGVLSDAEAEQILNLSEIFGLQEKLYQSWQSNLPEKAAQQAAEYYDNINEAYRGQFGASLDYQGAVTDSGELDQNYLNNQLSENIEDWRKEQFLGEAEGRELDLDVLQDYADHLANIADESDILADSLEEDSDAALLVARSVMSMNKGVEKLQDGFEDWNDVLSNSAKDSVEYSEALSGVKDALADMYEVEKDFISDDFITDHLKEIEKAATGDEDAIDGLRDALADDIVVNVVTANNKSLAPGESLIDLSTVQDEVANMRAWLDANPMEVGTRISLDDFNGDMDAFIDQCNSIISSAHMTADQANAFFDAMGFETTFVTEPEPVTKHGFSTITESRQIGTHSFATGDGDDTIELPTIETFTYPGTPYTYTDYVDAIAMEANSESGGAKVPKIESMTKKAGGSMNNASSRNSGGGGGGKKGGGGGGGKSKSNKPKKAERYHEITDKLDQQSKKIKEIATYEERAYGAERQKYVADHIAALQQEAYLYGELAKEAKNYLDSDKKALEQYGAKFNDDGTIKNYDEWYNKWAAKYKDDEDALAEFEEAIKNYEESLDKYIDAKQSQLEKLNEAYDLQLKNINDTLKEQNDLIQDNLDLLEYMFNRLNDDGSDAADAIAILNDELTQMANKADNYTQAITDLLENAGASAADIQGFLNGTISIDALADKLNLTPEAIDNLREYAKSLLEINNQMYEMREKAIEQLTKALDKFAEEADRAARKTEFYANQLTHLKNVIDVIGKDALGISNEILEGLANAAYQNALQQIQIARATMEEIEADRRMFEEQFANGLLTEEEYTQLMNDLDDRWMNAVENLADKEEEALQAATEVFNVHLTNIVEGFESAMSGAYKTLDNLQDAFEKQKKLNELYVDDYQKIHDLSKLNRDIQKSMDNTDNVKAMEYLKELQDEVNDGLREGNKLTAYDVEFLEKKYQLRLAEIALEEAQNAKNQVRMTRTSEGDWSYTYYADEEATANAQQNYEDKLYELEKLNQEYVKSVQDLIMDNMAQYRDEIASLNLTDEERTELLQQYYEELQQQYGVFLDKALKDGQWIETEFKVVDHNLINDWDETTLAAVTNFKTLEAMQDAFVTASQTMVTSLKATYEEWKTNWQTVLDTAGDNVDTFASDVQTASEEIIQAGADVVTAYEEQVKDQEENVWKPALENLNDFVKKWKNKIDEQINKNLELVTSIDELIRKYGDLAKSAEESAAKAVAAAAKAQKAAKDAADAAAAAARSAGSAANPPGGNTNPTGSNTNTGGTSGTSGYGGSTHTNTLMYMDSGGYTGEWGNEGRLAMLHEKELVLNKTDTHNILNTVEAVRDIAAQLSANASISAAGLGELASAGIKAGTQFEQIVNITAEFPDAVYHDEIKEAFDNLLGRTAQYLLRK